MWSGAVLMFSRVTINSAKRLHPRIPGGRTRQPRIFARYPSTRKMSVAGSGLGQEPHKFGILSDRLSGFSLPHPLLCHIYFSCSRESTEIGGNVSIPSVVCLGLE